MIIFDLDGTLSLIDHRRHFVSKKPVTKDDAVGDFPSCRIRGSIPFSAVEK